LGVEVGGALEECGIAVPVVGAAFGGEFNGTGGGAAGVGIFLRGANGEFLNGVGRKILEEAADVVVGVIAAVDGELVVEAGASAGGDGCDAGLGGIGGFDRFGAGSEIGDIGKAARGEREIFKVLAGDDALVNLAGEVHGLRGDGGALRLHVDGLHDDGRLHGHGDVADGTHLNGEIGDGIGESRRGDGHAVGSRREIVHAEVAVIVAGGGAGDRRGPEMDGDGGGRDACAATVLNQAAQRTAEGLGD
jgi:hypothetical protein